MATAPKIAVYEGEKISLVGHEIENVLAFDREQTINAGQTVILGTLDTSRFDKIRLVAANEESNCNVHLSLKILEPEGRKIWEPFNLDDFTLQPHNQLTRVYDVPATKVEVSMTAVGRRDTHATVEVLIYGQF